MKQPFYKRLVGGAAWFATGALCLCAASTLVSPAHCRFLGVVGLGFPFFLAGVLFMLALTLLLSQRHAWIPLIGLVACFSPIRTYCPVNFPTSPPDGSLKVLTYNTQNFGSAQRDQEGRNRAAAYMASSGADIVCFQEGSTVPPSVFSDEVLPAVRDVLPYFDTVNIENNILGCFTRFPIVGKRILCRNQTNGAAVFCLLLAPGDTLRVVNCHLESMHLSLDDRQKYHHMVRSPEESDVDGSSRLLVSKISRAAVERARQADLVADYVESQQGKSLLLCGDFNDSPISYTRRRIARRLTDAFKATGNGVGRSFNRDAIYVRIDYIMCSKDWKPYGCRVDRSATASDHYPVFAYLKRR